MLGWYAELPSLVPTVGEHRPRGCRLCTRLHSALFEEQLVLFEVQACPRVWHERIECATLINHREFVSHDLRLYACETTLQASNHGLRHCCSAMAQRYQTYPEGFQVSPSSLQTFAAPQLPRTCPPTSPASRARVHTLRLASERVFNTQGVACCTHVCCTTRVPDF